MYFEFTASYFDNSNSHTRLLNYVWEDSIICDFSILYLKLTLGRFSLQKSNFSAWSGNRTSRVWNRKATISAERVVFGRNSLFWPVWRKEHPKPELFWPNNWPPKCYSVDHYFRRTMSQWHVCQKPRGWWACAGRTLCAAAKFMAADANLLREGTKK